MFWCWGNHIHGANCKNTSFSSSAVRLEGTCLPLLLCWFNNSKQVFTASGAKAQPPPFIAERWGNIQSSRRQYRDLIEHFNLHVAQCFWCSRFRRITWKAQVVNGRLYFRLAPVLASVWLMTRGRSMREIWCSESTGPKKTEQSQCLAVFATGSSVGSK